ncbi:Pol polyprotein, partial [Mucuna pruriens]
MHEGPNYADNIHVAPSTLHNLTSPWSFFMWGLDMIGPIEPKASNGHKFILVAIDYFTKWVEVAPYASVTKSVVVKFIKKDIICRHSLLAHIITNNGTNLNNKIMTELCEQFNIKHHNSTPYQPKMNGSQLDQLNLIEEKRLMAICHGKLYQRQIKNAFDKKVQPHVFKEGDLVLRKILPNSKDARGKWAPNYEGLYIKDRSLDTRSIQMRSNCSTLESSTKEDSKRSTPESPGWRSQPCPT